MNPIVWSDFNLNKLISLLLPTFLRRINMVLFLRALLSPLDWLRGQTLYKMQHDCRVIYMEKVLNEEFNTPGYDPNDHNSSKVIYITDGNSPESVWLNTSSNPNKIWLGNKYLNTTEYYNVNYSDFIVHAPSILQASELRLRHTIEYYQLAGKAYKIQYF